MILADCWKNIKHIKEIIDECKLVKCNVLFIDFSNENWAKSVAKEIVKILKNGSRASIQRDN